MPYAQPTTRAKALMEKYNITGVAPLTLKDRHIILTHRQACSMMRLKLVRYCVFCFSYHTTKLDEIKEYYPDIENQNYITNWFKCDVIKD